MGGVYGMLGRRVIELFRFFLNNESLGGEGDKYMNELQSNLGDRDRGRGSIDIVEVVHQETVRVSSGGNAAGKISILHSSTSPSPGRRLFWTLSISTSLPRFHFYTSHPESLLSVVDAGPTSNTQASRCLP